MASPSTDTDAEDSSSASSPVGPVSHEFKSALDEFRDNWQRELKGGHGDIGAAQPHNESPKEQQTLAENLFRRAVELEQRGKVYDALPLYRKAVQINPDIEFQFYETQKHQHIANPEPLPVVRREERAEENENGESVIEDLYEKFQADLAGEYGGKLLLSSRDAGVLSTQAHLSDLPPELIHCILRWVVSAQLDMRSLEQCAAVCKGLYLCARDEDLWRLACRRVWGRSACEDGAERRGDEVEAYPARPGGYATWRQMFIERERVLFHGCYISKTTYLRMGENSFQDQFYRPVQLVEYYRYIRFLPDGAVLMLTNADEPATGVGKLRHLHQLRPEVLRGNYRLYGSTLKIVVQKQPRGSNVGYSSGTRQRRALEELAATATKYCLEFRIQNGSRRRCAQLIWLHYSIVQTRNQVETTSEFDLISSKYPPLWFSPVRSFHSDADAPLA